MPRPWILVGLLAVAHPSPGQERVALRVLYAGDGDTERAREFVAFLSSRAGSVRAVMRETVTASDVNETDVVVVDGDPEAYVARLDSSAPPRPPAFDLLNGIPTVLVGWVGLTTGSHWRLKTSLFLG